MLETLDHTIRIGSTPTFLYFDSYLHPANAGHNVDNSKVAVTWTKDGNNLYTTVFGSAEPRVSIKDQATLALINTTLSDNGTYDNTVTIAKTSKHINNLIVIIQGMYRVIAVNFPYSFTYLSYMYVIN